MPIVPRTTGRNNIQSAYTVRAVSNAAGFEDFGKGVSQLGEGIGRLGQQFGGMLEQQEAKKSEANINDAINKTQEDRIIADIEFKEKTDDANISLESFEQAKEEHQKKIADSTARGVENLKTDDEKAKLDEWSRRDFLGRMERTAKFNTEKLESINQQNATKQMHLSQAEFAAHPSVLDIPKVKLAIQTTAKSRNLSAEQSELFIKQEQQSTINTAIDKMINDDQLVDALSFTKEVQDEMDPKTHLGYVTRLEKAITDKTAVAAGKVAAAGAKTIADNGNVVLNWESFEETIKKLPEEQQDRAREVGTKEARYGEMIRTEQSRAIFFNRANQVSEGFNPDDLPYVEKAAMYPEQRGALDAIYEQRLNKNQKVENLQYTAKAEANTGRVSIALTERLSALDDEDAKHAPFILEEMLQSADAKGLLVEQDIKDLRKLAYARSKGESSAKTDDIMRAVSQIENKPDLINPATQASKDWKTNTNNSALISFVTRNTIGVPKEQLPEKINSLVKDYALQTRTHENVGDVLSRGDLKEISMLQLDEFSNMDSPALKAAFKSLNYGEAANSLTDDSKRKLLTRAKLRDQGLIQSYQYKDGKVVKIDVQEILTGIRLEEMAEQEEAPDNLFNPETHQGNIYD